MPRTSKYGSIFVDPYGKLNIYGGYLSEPRFVTLPSLNAEWTIGALQYMNQSASMICSVQVFISLRTVYKETLGRVKEVTC